MDRPTLRTRANSIEGGMSEIQRNIIGERASDYPESHLTTAPVANAPRNRTSWRIMAVVGPRR